MKIFFKDVVFLSFLIGFLVNTLLLPKIRKICLNNEFLDKRGNSEKFSIRFGGVSMLIGLLLTFLFLINRNLSLSSNLLDIKTLSIIFSGISLFSILGLLDDAYNLSPFLRLFFQIAITILIWSQGLILNVPSELTNVIPFLSSDLISLFFTIIWVTGITNAINWLDGLDGLASGYTLIASICFTYLGIINNQISIILIAIFICGTTLSFLKYNFFPSKLYMGDGGSYLLGSSLSIISLVYLNEYSSINDIFLILIILYVPLSDMFQVIFTRLLAGKSPFYPDNRHVHHRIKRLGFSHRSTVLIIYLYSFLNLILFFLSIKFKLNNLLIISYLSISLFLFKLFGKDFIKSIKRK